MGDFKLHSAYSPSGDQPSAIDFLSKGLSNGDKHQTLLGVTGSGKTYTIANVIQSIQKPTLVLAHNKTLAAQLFAEFKDFFPENSVNYFISYYDYYQPEAYVPSRDLFIEKESDINKDIERYRNAATQAALTRNDFIIVASVSCIYGIGSPEDYSELSREVKVGSNYPISQLAIHLTDMQYYRSEFDFYPGLFRVRGDTVDIYLVAEELALRLEYFGDEIESMKLISPVSGEVVEKLNDFTVYPAKQYVTPYDRVKAVIPQIEQDLEKEVKAFIDAGKDLEALRLKQRVSYDIEMLREVGYTAGIENYSRYLDGRPIGSPPSTLLDYMTNDWLLVVDESHMTIPQVRGMFNGDRARKSVLVEHGFRLRAALDNRPLKFDEFSQKLDQVIYVSATPAEYEISASGKKIVEQIIRPTGLLDPEIFIRPARGKSAELLLERIEERKLDDQSDALRILMKQREIDDQITDLIKEIRHTIEKKQRVLITTLTKKMSEELTSFIEDIGIKVQYIHSDIDAIERVEILKNLRLGVVDVVVGINLLREGLDLPEVSLVAILDADKEGFLRSQTSFVQTIGRAARHPEGKVIMYAERVTDSMYKAISETKRRRVIQNEYNIKHGITPTQAISKIKTQLEKQEDEGEKTNVNKSLHDKMKEFPSMKSSEKREFLRELEVEMEMAADSLEFEKAAEIRDFISEHRK